MDNDLPYRTPFNLTNPAPQVSSTDENNFSSLREIRQEIADEMARLGNITSLDLAQSELKVKQQIKAHQIAYGILEPLLQTLDSTLEAIDNKWRQ